MKINKQISFLIIILFAGFIMVSCGSSEDKIPGSWIAESVTPAIDSSLASPSDLAKIEHAINSQKTIKFTLNEDHSMSLNIDAYVSEAIWTFNDEDNMVTFRFKESSVGDDIELGEYKKRKIVYTSEVIHGTLTTIYVKAE